MKHFLNHIIIPVKTAVCLTFSASVCILMGMAWLKGWETVPVSLLFSLMLTSLAAGILQIAAFTEIFIKRMAYSWRMTLFAVLFLAVLTAIAVGFQWFPAEQKGSWLIFLGIFLTIFVITSAGFELYFRITGKKYDGLLGQYHKSKEKRPSGS